VRCAFFADGAEFRLVEHWPSTLSGSRVTVRRTSNRFRARDLVLHQTGHFAALERPEEVALILLEDGP
jgi:hypothetical protein